MYSQKEPFEFSRGFDRLKIKTKLQTVSRSSLQCTLCRSVQEEERRTKITGKTLRTEAEAEAVTSPMCVVIGGA